jgi:putative flippase GtrA
MARRLLNAQLVKSPRQLLTAGIGGAFGTGVDLGVLVLLVRHHLPIPLATFIAALAGAATNFTINKYVAFRDRSPISLGQVARFDFVAVVAALLMAAAMKIATANLGVPVVAAKLACAAIVFAIWTYPAQRRLVFARGAAGGELA